MLLFFSNAILIIGDSMETKEVMVDGKKIVIVTKMDPDDYESSEIITVEDMKELGDQSE